MKNVGLNPLGCLSNSAPKSRLAVGFNPCPAVSMFKQSLDDYLFILKPAY